MGDETVCRMARIMETSALLREALPEVRRLALIETLRASKGWEEGRLMLLENLETSPYIPREEKEPLAEMVLSDSWDEVRVALRCHQADSSDDMIDDGTCEVPADEVADPSQTHRELQSLRSMVVSIFSRSKKMQTISAERRQRIGSAIHRATSKEGLMELSLSSLESSEAFDFEARERIANDILDQRYDLLLLPDRFDCEDVPRLDAASAFSSRDSLRDTGEDINGKVVGNDKDECPVCLGARQVQCTTPCGHGFCRECISHWSVSDFVCPICRASVVKEPPRKPVHAARSISLDALDGGLSWHLPMHCPRTPHSQSLTALEPSISHQLSLSSAGNISEAEGGISDLRYDRLTVFQAAPLVWSDEEGGLHPIEMLDFDLEREMLSESVKDAAEVGAYIDLVFETATTDRLGAFLAKADETRALHFSCHGNPDYLCFEDGCGGAHFLKGDDLREFVSEGGGDLHFVFVSACYSRAVGECFVKAGALHVLCCQQDDTIMDVATAAFTGSFYRALACGKTLSVALKLGRQAVKLSPLVPDAEAEMDKYVLLPETVDHDVPVFYTDESRRRVIGRRPQFPSPHWILPHPPRRFVGREMDLYKILQALRRATCRLVRLTGVEGIGKRTLASAVCHYIRQRKRSFSIEELIWLPPMHTARINYLSTSFHDLFDLLTQQSFDRESYSRVCGSIMEDLYEKRAILVLDTKDFDESLRANLCCFLGDLINGTKDVKVILIDRSGLDVYLQNGCVECEIVINPLGFHLCAILFGVLCPYVMERLYPNVKSPRNLADLLVPKGQEGETLSSNVLSKRSVDVLTLIGEGIPSKIHAAAKHMKPHEYIDLIEIGKRKERRVKCQSHVELEGQLKDLKIQQEKAVRSRDFLRAEEIQEFCGELERLRESFPDLEELKKRAEVLSRDLEQAVSLKDFGLAKELNERLVHLEAQIKREEAATLQTPSSLQQCDRLHAQDALQSIIMNGGPWASASEQKNTER